MSAGIYIGVPIVHCSLLSAYRVNKLDMICLYVALLLSESDF